MSKDLIKTEIERREAEANGFVVPEGVAVSELKAFIEYHTDEKIDEEQVAKDYRETVKAIQRGLLDISNTDAPKLTLKDPIKSDQGETVKSSVDFLTRIKPGPLAALSKGMDISKDSLGLVNRMTAYLIQEPAVAMLDKFGKTDYKVIQQLTGLFQ